MLSSPSPTTDSSSHVSPSEPTPSPQNGKGEKSSANDEFDPSLPALLMSSSSSDWYIYVFGLWLLLIV